MSIQSTYARIKTAIFSGKKSAYFGMLTMIISPFTQKIDRLFSKQPTKKSKIGPTILIVCPPRTGGTIVYQVLSYLIPCIYLSNAHQFFPFSGTKKLLRLQKKGLNRLNLDNFFGYSFGLTGVNEGNESIGNFYQKGKSEIRNEFLKFYSRIIENNSLPLIFKNVRHYENIADLCEQIPELRIIRVKRNLEQATQSEFLAYQKLKYFHPVPKNIEHLYEKISPHEFAVRQMIEMNKSIESALSKIDESRFIELEYENFCLNPMFYAKQVVSQFCNGSNTDLRKEVIPLKASNSRKIDHSDALKISEFIKKMANE